MATIGLMRGTVTVIKNIKMRQKMMATGVSVGIKKAGLKLLRASQLLVPVDFGVLKASGFSRTTGTGFGTIANVGYTASYAIYVHENVEMKWRGLPRKAPSKGNYWDPKGRGQSKFLEQPVRTMSAQLRKEILAAAKIR